MRSTEPLSFEAAFTELEETLVLLESESLPLERALSLYKRGSELAKYCQSLLDEAEQRLEILEQENTEEQQIE